MSSQPPGASVGHKIGLALNVGAAIGIILVSALAYGYIESGVGAEKPPILSAGAVTNLRAVAIGVALVLLLVLPRILRQFGSPPPGSPDETVLVQSYVKGAAIVVGVAEVPALFGFGLAITGGNIYDALGLGATSLVLLTANFPKFDEWRQLPPYDRTS